MKASVSLCAVLLATVVAACSAGGREGNGSALVENEVAVASGEAVLGADRVGDMLRSDTSKIPVRLSEVEAFFGIGRECSRPDSKEIYVVEETQGRKPNGDVIGMDIPIPLSPRSVISGCNEGNLRNGSTLANSYDLFVALVSDPDRADQTSGDGILQDPIEIMAKDRELGTYNFYVFAKDASGKPQVTRIFRKDDGRVVERRLVAGDTRGSDPAATEHKCFSCHANGAPFMNELRDPWTNWISFKKNTPLSAHSGTTAELVSESVPNHETGRSSLANDLEPVMRAAIRAHVSDENGRGFAPNTARLSGGVAQLFESVFCETELNFASSTDAVPMEAYLDPSIAFGDLIPPPSFGSVPSPFQLPIRSEFDHAVERWLENEGYTTRSLTQAIRLLDDANDVFSDARCVPFRETLKPGLSSGTGTPSPEEARARVARHVAARIATVDPEGTQPKRREYLESLMDPDATPEGIEAARLAYASELAVRFRSLISDTEAVTRRELDRKARAHAMFPAPATPLPLLTYRHR